MNHQMDAIDVIIVSQLQNDGTLTNAAIAKHVPVSEETVRRRIKRLVEEGLIRVVAIPDPVKLGYETEVLIGAQVESDKITDVADALADMPEITWVTVSTGAYDIFAWAILKSSADLSNLLLTKGRRHPGRAEDRDVHQPGHPQATLWPRSRHLRHRAI